MYDITIPTVRVIKPYKNNRLISVSFSKTDVLSRTNSYRSRKHRFRTFSFGKCYYFIYILLSISFKLTKKLNKYNLKKIMLTARKKKARGKSASRTVADIVY